MGESHWLSDMQYPHLLAKHMGAMDHYYSSKLIQQQAFHTPWPGTNFFSPLSYKRNRGISDANMGH